MTIEHRRVVPKKTCIAVAEGNEYIANFVGPRAVENATAFAKLGNPVDGSGFLTIEQELEYHRAQDGLLTEAQERVCQLASELAEVRRPLEEQMARLNASLIERNAVLDERNQTILWLRKALDAYRGQVDRFGSNSAGDALKIETAKVIDPHPTDVATTAQTIEPGSPCIEARTALQQGDPVKQCPSCGGLGFVKATT